MNREQIEDALRDADQRGYPCDDPSCCVWECDITRAAQAALVALDDNDRLFAPVPQDQPTYLTGTGFIICARCNASLTLKFGADDADVCPHLRVGWRDDEFVAFQ